MTPDVVAKREGWKGVTGEKVGLSGDVCMANECLAVVFRKGSKGGEWYYRLGDAMVKGPTLVPVGADGDKARRLESFTAIESTPESVLLEVNATTETGKKIAARFLLKKGKPFVETQPGEGAEKLLVEARSQHAVVPDPFASDLVISAQDAQPAAMRLPSENMVVQLTDDRQAIVMCVWRSADQAARVTLDGAGEDRAITGTEIAYRKDRHMNVWVAVLAAPQIWHQVKISELGPVKDRQLDWQMPYLALWRADFRRTDGLIDSWKVIIKKPNGEWDGFGVSPKKGGTVWHPARGTFAYPAHLEGDSVYLRNSVYERRPNTKNKPDGWVVIYPFRRIGGSPKNVYGVMDVVKGALEETPEFTLSEDLEVKRMPWDRYPGVCGTTEAVEKMFDANEENAKKKEIVERFKKMNFFCVVVRTRIEEYMNWRKKTREFCIKAKAAEPQAAGLMDELDGRLAGFEKTYESAKLQERTPAAAHALTDKIEAQIGSDDPKRVDAVKELGRATRTIASYQDAAVGELRMIAKETRQQAGYRMMETKEEASFGLADDIRRRTLDLLRSSMGVEGGFTD